MARFAQEGLRREQGPPAAPWRTEVDALLWWHAVAPSATARPRPPLDRWHGAPVALGGLVTYHASPVGSYRELFAAGVLVARWRPYVHVHAMAVDSPASVAGGRRNWALPKELARFEADPADEGRIRVVAERWTVQLTAATRPRGVPTGGRVSCAQVGPQGRVHTFGIWLWGPARRATVEVEVAVGGDDVPPLRQGRHRALAVSGHLVITAATPPVA